MINSTLSSTTNNPKILSEYITSLSETRTKADILQELSKVDEQLYQLYEVGSPRQSVANSRVLRVSVMGDRDTSALAESFSNTSSVALGVPKNNSLTDSFLRSTLGCEEKLAKSYLQIVDQTDLTEELQRQKRIEQARRRFAEANNFKDPYANCKPFQDKIIHRQYLKKAQPVIDNQHDAYLKTQLIYMQKPLVGSKKLAEKEYYDKHTENVARKINEIGGMEDTVANMEESLARNQLRNFSRREHFTLGASGVGRGNRSAVKRSKEAGLNNWVDRSRAIREALRTKFDAL